LEKHVDYIKALDKVSNRIAFLWFQKGFRPSFWFGTISDLTRLRTKFGKIVCSGRVVAESECGFLGFWERRW